MAGYSNLPGYYPPTTMATAGMHKLVPPHLSSPYGSTSVPPTLGLPSLGLGHPLGLNGAPQGNPNYGKDLLRR